MGFGQVRNYLARTVATKTPRQNAEYGALFTEYRALFVEYRVLSTDVGLF